MDADTHSKTSVADAVKGGFIAVKLDLDANGELSKKYRVDGIPHQVIVDGGEEEITALSGYCTEKVMLKMLATAAKGGKEFVAARKAVAGSPDDAAANSAFAKRSLEMGNEDLAWKHLDLARKVLEAKAALEKKDLELLAETLAALGRLSVESRPKTDAEAVLEAMKKAIEKGAPRLQDNADLLAKLLSFERKPDAETLAKVFKEFQELAAKHAASDQRDFMLMVLAGIAAELEKYDDAEEYLKELTTKLSQSPLVEPAEQLLERIGKMRKAREEKKDEGGKENGEGR